MVSIVMVSIVMVSIVVVSMGMLRTATVRGGVRRQQRQQREAASEACGDSPVDVGPGPRVAEEGRGGQRGEQA
eukprot:scaffold28341_cov48-Phaeocystis_antarctica.AAC.1